MQKLALAYLRWRYGGDVYALKNPLGFRRGCRPTPAQWAKYALRYWLWLVEDRAFQRHGQPMRDNWNKAFGGQ